MFFFCIVQFLLFVAYFVAYFSPFICTCTFCNYIDRLQYVYDTAAPVKTRKSRRVRKLLDEIFNSKFVWRLVIRLYKYAWVLIQVVLTTYIQTVSSYLQSLSLSIGVTHFTTSTQRRAGNRKWNLPIPSSLFMS